MKIKSLLLISVLLRAILQELNRSELYRRSVVVCLKINLLCNAALRREQTRLRVARHRARKLLKSSGEAWLYTHCRECERPIEPSYLRGFCPRGTGRQCRKNFFARVQVRRVEYLDFTAHYVSTRALEVLHG
jgi:hypothetical protein